MPSMSTIKITLDNRTIFRILAVVVAFMLALNFLSAVEHALTLIAISAFLAMALNPPVSYLSSKITGGSRAAATGIAYMIVLTVIMVFVSTMIPPFIDETGDFITNFPQYIEDATQGNSLTAQFVNQFNLETEIEEIANNFTNQLSDASGPLFTSIERIGATIFSVLTVLVLTFFMLVEGPAWIKRFWKTQPKKHRKHRKELATRMYNVVTGYVNGQLVIATLAGFASLIAMLLVGIPFALPLAGLVAMFGLIPLIGATLGSVLVVIVALFQGVPSAIVMAVFFLVYQQIENNVIQPYVQSKTLDVSPLLVLIAVLFGVSVGGILGGFVAIPVAAAIRILVNDWLDHRTSD